MITYQYDPQAVDIREIVNGEDVEFHIRVVGDAALHKQIKDIYHDYEHNGIHTDVIFYVLQNHEYQFIVRKDFYNDFVISLMKYRIVKRVEWK